MPETSLSDISLKDLRIGGTEVHYFVLCPRKLWWFSHGMEQEHVSGGAGAENVALGQVLHQESYQGKARKDVLIDDLLRLDFTDGGVVHEVKKRQGRGAGNAFSASFITCTISNTKRALRRPV